MSSAFHVVGNVSVNVANVLDAEWVDDPTHPKAGSLVVHFGNRDRTFPFDAEGVAELAAAVGLGEHAKEHAKEAKKKHKAEVAAEHAAEEAAAAA